ncbi:MAG TPA: hypothetical protein DCZ01_04020 [Elusimicrobia bacterium]|nr:MAG: hypothetical protein A2X37_12500 [Elusimicrobia bacterium GWA2_66_18]OGR69848.1 MAG: hypothetical protein A2X40_07405 [Elusimicrobia bacterium GWC2_65_9]HAZ07691.1 hypothetical protein [Elusimicrobiota bacterium]
MADLRRRAAFFSLLLALTLTASLRAQGRVEVVADAPGASGISRIAGVSTLLPVSPVRLAGDITASLAANPSVAPMIPLLAAAPAVSPSAAFTPPTAAPLLFPAAKGLETTLPKSPFVGSGDAAAATKGQESESNAGDALFDARRLQADDNVSLLLSGYRFDEATSRILTPNTGQPLTNAQARALQNSLRERRNRLALLRLSRKTGAGDSPQRKAALIDINRDALPREVRMAAKAGPQKEQATILRRLASLYRRWLERASAEGNAVVSPANAETEEKLGALIAEAAVKRFSDDPEGARLLDSLRDEYGKLRLPTMRVLRLDARYGAMYTSYGRQLIISLNYLKPLLLARLPQAERADAEKSLATEAGALAYLSQSPARVASLIDSIDVTLFHELVHFRQDHERPLMTAISQEEIPTLATYEHEYEAYFRQDLYIHSRLSRPDAKLDIDRIDDYLRLIDDFDAWKGVIDRYYATNFLNGYVMLEELTRLQSGSQRMIERLAGPEGGQSAAASKRLKAAARGTQAIETEKKAAEAELAEYRRRWPALARDGLRRWVEINERLGRWPQVGLAQDRLARLAESPADAAAWKGKAERSIDRALLKLEHADGLNLNERIEWINALAAYFNGRGEIWKKELWIASFRDYPAKARELRAAAEKSAEGVAKSEFLRQAESFERAVDSSRATLRDHAESDLSAVFAETDPLRRKNALTRGYMAASVLGDAELIAAFKPLAQDPTQEGWNREAARTLDKMLIRLAEGRGDSLNKRIAWINALVAHANGRGKPWKKELWIAFFRDYPAKAGELRAAAAKSAEGAAKSEFLRQAESFERAVDSSRATLRGHAEANLAESRTETNPILRANLLDWGSMQAEVLGDAALIDAFKYLMTGMAAAGR